MSTETYYDLLGVTPDADTDQIRAAFRQLSMKIHPDSGGTDALFRTVKEAYDTLSDPVRRQQYDDLLSSPAGMYGNDEQEYNAPGWVRVDDTPSGNETSEPGHNGNHADSPPSHTEHDGAYRFNFTGNNDNQADSPPSHGDTWYTPPPSGQPPGHNGFASGYFAPTHADSETLAHLVLFDKDPFVRYEVAVNPRTPTQSLSYLSVDKNPFIRYAAATNPHTPIESLNLLAMDSQPFVRYAAATNPHTSYEYLRTLLSDKIPAIRMAADHTLSLHN